ncbi:hypothetical protein RIF29_36403 [Crotalaria pallida]|uniref:Legume lectin domain-containing protein n=1 Tax=Crotalaria pallida TaxID=3830 RepID=A0AAN9HUK7_CROPI
MANSKSTISSFLMIFIICFLLIITNVKSDDITAFNFPSFEPGVRTLLLDGDANTTTEGILQLTKTDPFGKPLPHGVGLAGYYETLHLWDKKSGRVADFTTEFTFVVNPKSPGFHGDGFTFFLASLDFEFPDNATGGFLGLFNKETAFNTSLNKVVAVEFDSFANEWDTNFFPGTQSPHIGINVNSIRSVAAVAWPSEETQPQGEIAKARITYRSYTKELAVFLSYPNGPVKTETIQLSFQVNFAAVLSEQVLVGFSASTGELVETHDILSWSFDASTL